MHDIASTWRERRDPEGRGKDRIEKKVEGSKESDSQRKKKNYVI